MRDGAISRTFIANQLPSVSIPETTLLAPINLPRRGNYSGRERARPYKLPPRSFFFFPPRLSDPWKQFALLSWTLSHARERKKRRRERERKRQQVGGTINISRSFFSPFRRSLLFFLSSPRKKKDTWHAVYTKSRVVSLSRARSLLNTRMAPPLESAHIR